MKVALIAGATGLIGKQLLELLLNSSQYSTVIALTRTPLSIQHQKLHNSLGKCNIIKRFRSRYF